jgi:hypothetical protein
MLLKSLMNKPILAIGILLMAIFLMNTFTDGGLWNRDRLNPTSCKAVLVKLDRRVSGGWSTSCDGENLNLAIAHLSSKDEPTDMKTVRKIVYRELANSLVFIAKNSPTDNLERTPWVSIRYVHPKLEVGALTEGKFLVKFSTIKNKEMLMNHLKATVQVKELIK